MSSTNSNDNQTRMVGQVKWFNNKAGYGFITVNGESQYAGKDIFVHYSTINVGEGESQYRYLVQGEYVEFQLSVSTNTTHEFQATHISGINGGMLMCQTRQLNRPQRSSVAVDTKPNPSSYETKRRSPYKKQTADKPVAVDNDGFKVVTKKRSVALNK
jgi:cold shock CspA family protein